MKKIIVFLLFLTLSSKAQKVDFGVMIGAMNYRGDLAPSMKLSDLKWGSITLLSRINLGKGFAFRPQLAYGNIGASDNNSDDSFARVRNHSFSASLFEAAGLLEFNFFDIVGKYKTTNFYPYLFLGGAFYTHSTRLNQPTFNEDINDVNPEKATTIKSSGSGFCAPIGVGFRLKFGQSPWLLGFEVGSRVTFSDKLDGLNDLSTSGFSNTSGTPNTIKKYLGDKDSNDIYYSLGFTVTYQLYKIICPH